MEALVDIIEFARPLAKEKNLYVTGISSRLTEGTVLEKLHEIFSRFGLLYEIQALGGSKQNFNEGDQRNLTTGGHQTLADEGQESSTTEVKHVEDGTQSGWFAFVKYYSSHDARRAQQAVNGKYLVDGKLLKVKYATRQKPRENIYQLGLRQCTELANHYLGFSGWSTRILTLDKDTECLEVDTARFIATVRIDVTSHNAHSEGIGVGEFTYSPQDPTSKQTAFHRAKKIAHQRASEGAFSKLVLAVLPDGRVAVEVNCTAVDAQHFVTEEEVLGSVQVTKVDPSSLLADDERNATIGGNSTNDLDGINVQVLLDLQMGGQPPTPGCA